MSFLKTWGKNYSGQEVPQIIVGKKVDPRAIRKKQCLLLGNCAAKLQNLGIFLEGCPPIPSDILRAIDKTKS
jgi:hypothetical protein